MSDEKYLVFCEAEDGRAGTVTLGSDEELERFKESVAHDGITSRYAVFEFANAKFVNVPQEGGVNLEHEIALARARHEELRERYGDDLGDPEKLGLPVIEQDGFKIVNASGGDLPPEVMETLLEALIESGQLRYDEEGKIVPGPNASAEGELVGLDVRHDADGSVIKAERIDVKTKKQLN